jgi:hypothetical protein
MSAKIINIFRTANLYPRYRRAPTEPAIVIILPVVRVERAPDRAKPIMSPATSARIRRELEKLRELK